MHRQGVDVVVVGPDDSVQQAVLDSKDDGQFGAAVHLSVADLRVVDLFQRAEMDVGWGCPVHLRRLKNNARGRCVGKLGGLPQQRVQEIDHVELTQPIHLKVSVKAVDRLSWLIDIDAGRQN